MGTTFTEQVWVYQNKTYTGISNFLLIDMRTNLFINRANSVGKVGLCLSVVQINFHKTTTQITSSKVLKT